VTIVKSALVPRLKAPIALVHGLFGFERFNLAGLTVASYFPGVYECMAAAGNRVLVPKLHPTAAVADRAQQFKDFLLRESPDEPVHLIAHSLGGLDSRYMISRLGMAKKVLSLTTLGTPHHGTPFADWLVGRVVGAVDGVVRSALKRLRIPHQPLYDLVGNIPLQAFNDLTTAKCRDFNEDVLSAPNVSYYSVAGRYHGKSLSLEWLLPYGIVYTKEGENDGVVSVTSARWGDGFEVWEGDHFSLVNWSKAIARDGIITDPSPRYGPLLGRLADLGY
jgi:triacylglycerol lipase